MTNYVQTGDIDGTHPFRISNEDDVTDWLVDITSDRVVHLHGVSIEVDSGSLPALKLSNQGGLLGDQLQWTDDLGTVIGKIINTGDFFSKNIVAVGGLSLSTANSILNSGGLVLWNPSTVPISFYNAHGDANTAFAIWDDGALKWGLGGTHLPDVQLYRSQAGTLRTDGHFVPDDSLEIKTKAGAISDADFANAPGNGTLGLDTTNHRLYYRRGGAWHYVAETA